MAAPPPSPLASTTPFDLVAARAYEFMEPRVIDEQREIDVLLHYALRAGSVLDVGAGTGRNAIPIAERNIPVTCIDVAPDMLEALLIKIAPRPELHPYITTIACDTSTVDLKQQYAMAHLYRTLFYLRTDESRVKLLKNIYRHVQPGGWFLVDGPLGPREAQKQQEYHSAKVGRSEYKVHLGFERETGTYYNGFIKFETYLDGEKIESREHVVPAADIPNLTYLHDLVREAGFEVEESFSKGFEPTTQADNPDYAMVVARRKK